jgi:Zn-dependent oligopeptidase
MYKKRHLNIGSEKIKEYFPTDYVINKLLGLYEYLFAIKFEKVNIPVWHKDVQAFAVRDNGEFIGYSYIDAVPREGKYTHAECDDIITYIENPDATKQLPVAVLISNASLPGNGVPSLLSVEELGTLLHESGHAMNFIFNRFPYAGLTSDWDCQNTQFRE